MDNGKFEQRDGNFHKELKERLENENTTLEIKNIFD